MRALLSVIACSCALVLGGTVSADDGPAAIQVRVVPIRAVGERSPADRPAIDPRLRSFAPLLDDLPFDRFVPLSSTPPVQRVAAGATATFDAEQLGAPRHSASVAWSAQGERLVLEVSVLRERRPPERGSERMVTMRVAVPERGSYLVRCAGAYPDGELLLLITAGSEL